MFMYNLNNLTINYKPFSISLLIQVCICVIFTQPISVYNSTKPVYSLTDKASTVDVFMGPPCSF